MTTDAYILHLIICGTSDRPISIAELEVCTRLTPRSIKAAVERLRKAGEPIGASRGAVPGYYLIRTAEDADQAVAPLWRQILSELETVRRMLPPARYRELVGQLRMEA